MHPNAVIVVVLVLDWGAYAGASAEAALPQRRLTLHQEVVVGERHFWRERPSLLLQGH